MTIDGDYQNRKVEVGSVIYYFVNHLIDYERKAVLEYLKFLKCSFS